MSTVDLRQLAVRREIVPAGHVSRRRHLVTRYLLPGAVLLGFLAVLAWAARDTYLPSKPVTVVPVLATRAEMRQEGAPLFQSAGWVEPRPTPVLVTALTEGVVEDLLVVEGQEVKAGDPVARLITDDALLAVRMAEADVRLQEAERMRTRAALKMARAILARPVQLEAAAAEADAVLAQKETELADLPFQLRTAQTRLQTAQRDYDAIKAATSAAPEVAVRRASAEAENAATAVDQLKTREPRLRREIEALQSKRDALLKRLELKIEETREVADCEAHCDGSDARVEQARTALDAAKLRLKRMTVRAPCAGRVLALSARPGMRLMGLTPGSLHDSSTVVSLYDPDLLQVRADVRLEDVPRVQPGQPVRIETPAVPGGLEGEVLQATSQADMQKNTLQVKVSVKTPPPVLKPDMLVQVTFLAPPKPEAPANDSDPFRLMVPRQLVETSEGGARVWVADQAAGVARLRLVKIGQGQTGDLVEVVEGLTAADKLIAGGRDGLRDGQRVTITGEDGDLGSGTQSVGSKTKRLPRTPTGDDAQKGNR